MSAPEVRQKAGERLLRELAREDGHPRATKWCFSGVLGPVAAQRVRSIAVKSAHVRNFLSAAESNSTEAKDLE